MTGRTRPARRRRSHLLLAVLIVAALLPGALPSTLLAAEPSTEPEAAPVPTQEAGSNPDTQDVRIPFASVATGPVAPGTSHEEGVWTTDRGTQWVHVVDVDLQNPLVGVEAGLSNGRVTGLETLGGQAARVSTDGHRVVAAINGDVWGGYANSSAHAPNGLHVQDGEVVSATRIQRPTVGIFADGTPHMADVGLELSVALADGVTVLGVDRVNKARPFNDLVLFTRRFGSSTLTSTGGVEVVLEPGSQPLRPSGTFTATATLVRSGGDTPIAPGTFVLSADGLAESALRSIPVGSVLTLTTLITPGWEQVQQAIGGREWVLRDGFTNISPRPSSAFEIHPRTGVGITPAGDLVLVVVDGRQAGYSNGTTLPDLAELFRQRGAVHALNLDGGGSTTMLVREPGDISARLANEPSDGRQRAVSNSLLVVSRAPTGPLSTILLRPGSPSIVVGNSIPFTARGHDVYYNGISLAGSLAWTVDSLLGTIDADGRFVAMSPGTGQVTAFAQGVSTSTTLTVLPDTVAPAPRAPTGRLHTGSITSPTSVAWSVSWPVAFDDGSGVASYRLRQRVDFGPWVELPLEAPLTREVRLALEPGHDYQFGVAATDAAGNVSEFIDGPAFRATHLPESHHAVRYSSGWSRATWSGYIDGGGRWARRSGSVARFTFTGSHVAWVAPFSSTRGSARVYVDGRYAGTVSLFRRTTESGRIAFSRGWSTTGRHTIEIRVLGTRGHPRVDVDGFVVVHPAPPR